MELHRRLYEISISDLESAEILFKSKKYHVAIFQLQQSVEKMVKSFGVKVDLIKPEDLQKKIRHLPHKVFARFYAKQIEKYKRLSKGPIFIPEMVPPHQRNIGEYEKRIELLTVLYNKINFAELKENRYTDEFELRRFLDGGTELSIVQYIDEEELFEKIKEDFIKTNNHLIEYFSHEKEIQKDIEFLNNNYKEIVKNKVLTKKSEIENQDRFRYISYIWINLSFILSPHEQTTRYSSTDGIETPLDLYNSENVLIKNFEEIISAFKESIDKYNEIYS